MTRRGVGEARRGVAGDAAMKPMHARSPQLADQRGSGRFIRAHWADDIHAGGEGGGTAAGGPEATTTPHKPSDRLIVKNFDLAVLGR